MKRQNYFLHQLAGLIVMVLAVVVLGFSPSSSRGNKGSVLGLSQASVVKETDTDFNQGLLSETVVSGTGNGALIQLQGDGGAGWFDATWPYRAPVVITNSGSVQTNYQVRLAITYDAQMQADFDDLRFANAAGTPLDFWLQSKVDSTSAVVWVEVDSLAGSADTTIYMYYGKVDAETSSNGVNTFQFFDDFNDDSLDPVKWTKVDPRTKMSEANGKLRFIYGSGNGNWDAGIYSNPSFARSNLAIEYDLKWISDYSPYDAFMFGWKDDGAGISYTNLVYGYYNQGDGTCVVNCVGPLYEDGSLRGNLSGTWTKDLDYQIRLRLKSAGGNYYEKSTNGGTSFTTDYDSSYSNESTLHMAWMHYSGDYEIDNARVRKWMTSEPTAAFGAEEMALSSSGTWTSPTNSNVIDLGWNGGWGDGTDGSTAFSATIANVAADATINFQMKVATSVPDLTSASYIDLGTANNGTTFTKTRAELNALGVGTGTNRYAQILVTFAQTSGVNPQLNNVGLFYQVDNALPSNPPDVVNLTAKSEAGGGGSDIATDTWYNFPTPYFSWTGAVDPDSGIAGYYVYFGTDPFANPSDPELGLSVQALANYTASSLVTNTTYYLRIKTVDVAGNVAATTWAPFNYKYENTQPTNPGSISVSPVGYTSVNSFLFNWSTGSDEVGGSGLSSYCYKTGTTDDESPYYTDQCQVGRSIGSVPAYQSGENYFYVRAKDNAGNLNSQYTSLVYYWNENAPSAPRNVVVTQAESLSGTSCVSLDNCFSVTWDLPETYLGSIASYYYAVNTDPMTLINSTQTSESETNARSLAAQPLATKQGLNTFYIVAKDNSGNVNFDEVAQGTGVFLASTTAPGSPTNMQITDSSNRDTAKYQLTLTWDAPVFVGSGIDHYNIYRSTDNVTFAQIATATGGSTGYLDTGLVNGATYYYEITAEDNALAEGAPSSIVSAVPTGRYTTAPEILIEPSVAPSILSATVSWKMARTCQGYVQIRLSSSDSYTEQGAGSNSTDQSVTVVGLTSNTIYLYRIRCQDIDGNNAYSSEGSFKTNDAPSSPINLTAVPAENTQNSFAFTWDAPEDLGVTIAYYYFSVNQEPTALNITKVLTDSLPVDAYATQQEENTLYVLAVDSAGNYNLNNYATVSFTAQTTAPGIPTNVTITDSSSRASSRFSLTMEWDTATGSPEYYEVFRSINGTTFAKVSEINSTIYSETQLDTNIKYYYYVLSVDNAGARSAKSTTVDKQPTGKYVTPPEYTSEPDVVVTSTSATIGWTTNRTASSFVLFGKTSELGQSTGSLSNTLVHEVVLTGLDPSATYHYKLQSFDEARDYDLARSESEEYTLTTLIAPAISDVKVDEIRQTSALLVWKTSTVSSSIVKYGTTTDYGLEINDESTGATTLHTVRLTGLEPENLYHVRIFGSDTDGNNLQSDDYVFQTLAFPRIFNLQFEPVEEASSATLQIVWETNVETDTIVEFAPSGGRFDEQVQSALIKTHEIKINNLIDNTSYSLRAKGRDQYGNIAQSELIQYDTPYDTRPPKITDIVIETAIQGVGKDASAQIIVSWKTDENATSQVEYGEGVGGTSYASKTVEDGTLTNSHVVIMSDLASAKPFHLRVVSHDGAGNQTVSDDHAVITGRATESVFDLIIVNLQESFGWLGSISSLFGN